MKPSEVIAMRDRLSEWLATEYRDSSDVLAESLIKSGWVVAPPKNEKQEVCGKVFRTYEFSYTCPKGKGHEGECDD